MAKQLVLISHGHFCEALKASTEMIMGPQECLHTVPLLPEEGIDDYQKKLANVLSQLTDYVVCADLLGGTPCNVAARLLIEGATFDLYAGMNMPMVIGFLNGILLGEEVDLIHYGADGVKYINPLIASTTEED